MLRVVWSTLILTISVALPSLPAETLADSRSLHPDLALQFICKGKTRSMLEDAIEVFLQHEGFKVLNLGRVQREHDVFLLDVHIVAVDNARRIVDIISMPPAEDRYALRLTSPPPTRHASQLEEAFQTFVSDQLGCKARQVGRGDNDADASSLFDWEVGRIENLFREAEQIEGKRPL